jgi:Family of unknown function (DUF6527)
MRQVVLRLQSVEFIPEQLEDGVLYVSRRYRIATHRCCCGCGSEVVTPLGPAYWTCEVANGAVSLRPSIGNWSLPCRSHYLIRQGKVIWARDMSYDEIEWGRRRDQRLRDAHSTENNRRRELERHTPPAAQPSGSWLARFWRAFRRGSD